MISVTLNFSTQDELISFFSREPRLGSAERPLTDADARADLEGKPRPSSGASAKPRKDVADSKATATTDAAPGKTDTPQATTAASAETAPQASTAATEGNGAAAATAQAATAAPTAFSVDYPTLQKAVFTLAGKSRGAASAVAASFGVKTFKELPEAKWAEALAAVQAKIAEL